MKKNRLSPRKSITSTDTTKVDLYQQITDRIVIALENGVPPWKKPWRSITDIDQCGMPRNASTGQFYRGINVLLLWMAAEEKGFCDNRWLTYRQAQQAGGHVLKGEKSSLAVVYKDWVKQAEDVNGQPIYDNQGNPIRETIPMIKALQLFNITQCDGLPDAMTVSPAGEQSYLLSSTLVDSVMRMVNASGVKYRMCPQDRAYYTPLTDQITTPLAAQFLREADYWSTLLHELVHSTGHGRRLNRKGITTTSSQFDDSDYAFEELIAEMGSAFLCAQLGVFGEIQHDSYVDYWLRILRSDKKALFRACRQAREATEYLLTFSAPAVSSLVA